MSVFKEGVAVFKKQKTLDSDSESEDVLGLQIRKRKEKLVRYLNTLKKLLAVPSINNFYRKAVYDKLKGDKEQITLFTVIVVLISEIPLYFFTILDLLQLKSLFKYRLHYKKEHVAHLGIRHYPPRTLTLNTLKVAEKNFFLSSIVPAAILIKLGAKMNIFVYDTEEGENKLTWKRFFKEFSLVVLLADVFFWICHRSFHTPGLYLTHHKVHHEFKYSIASAHHWSTFYEAAWFTLPQALAPLVVWAVFRQKVHVMSMWAGVFFAQLSAIIGHAGYNLPFIPKWLTIFQPEYHDMHHIDHMSNFAAMFTFTDKLFGTYVKGELEHDMAKILSNVKKPSKFLNK